MPRWMLWFVRVAGMAALVSNAAASDPQLPAEVQSALDSARIPHEALAVVVQEIGSRQPRLAWQARQAVNPASLMKLVTTGAALDLLGPAWTWRTPVWIDGSLQRGVLHGNLVIKGSGDPKLVLERLWLLLRRVQQFGVREIRGDIVLDRSAFSLPEQHPGDFDGELLRPYNVGPDALLLNYKSLLFTITPDPSRGTAVIATDPPLAGVRSDDGVPLVPGACDDWQSDLKADFTDPARLRFRGSFAAACGEKQWAVAYADPRGYSQRLLSGLWRGMGGKLAGQVRDGSAPSDPPTFELMSPPLAELVRDINKFSNNVMAQQLFFTLGATLRGSGTREAAREVLLQWLQERHGEAALGSVIDNGSGLSREGRLSAELLARVLQNAWAGPTMSEMVSSLPVSGIDGTTRRWRNASPGRAHLKTGSLRDVAGIAGYVLADDGRRHVVVAIVNHANAGAARPALEAVVQWAARSGASAALSPPPPALKSCPPLRSPTGLAISPPC